MRKFAPVAALLLALAGCSQSSNASKPEPPEVAAPASPTRADLAIEAAQSSVRERLSHPSTAVFLPGATASIDDEMSKALDTEYWTIAGKVKAKNSFGLELTYDYTAWCTWSEKFDGILPGKCDSLEESSD